MLLKLPLDILINIISHLSIYEKLQLVLTCKRFKEAILDRCLYETLYIPFNKEDETESIVLKFRMNRSKGQQVKNLGINLDRLSNQLYREIPLIFPNVVKFSYDHEDHDSRPEETSSKFIRWKDTLKVLSGTTGKKSGIILKLLEKNVFSRLTDLSLREYNGDQLNLVHCIKNAPSLESLDLEGYSITIEMIESIHSACSLLNTFTLGYCRILVSETETLPKKITPSLRLSHLKLMETYIHDHECIFLDYLTRTYTKLVQLELNLYFLGDNPCFFSLNQGNEEMNSNPNPTTRCMALHSTGEKFLTSASKKLSKLPDTLKSLKIYQYPIDDIATLFSKSCINLTRVDFLNDLYCDFVLATPQDIKTLAQLPHLKYLRTDLDLSIQNYEKVPALTSVVDLHVIVKERSALDGMNIGWILSVFPSLNSLEIESPGARLVAYQSDPPQTYPSLTKLTVRLCKNYSSLFKYICNVVPNVKYLYWIHGKQNDALHADESSMENGKVFYTINLSGFFLDWFHLEIDDSDRELYSMGYILVLKGKHDRSSTFVISNSPRRAYYAGPMIRYVEEQINTIFTIQCGFTKTIIINRAISIDVEKSTIQQKYR